MTVAFLTFDSNIYYTNILCFNFARLGLKQLGFDTVSNPEGPGGTKQIPEQISDGLGFVDT